MNWFILISLNDPHTPSYIGYFESTRHVSDWVERHVFEYPTYPLENLRLISLSEGLIYRFKPSKGYELVSIRIHV